MSQILHIEASPNGERSVSIAMGRAFLDAYAKLHPTDDVRTLNVWTDGVPTFGPEHAAAKFAPLLQQERTAEQASAWLAVEQTIRDFDAADKIVLSCPMWNFSVPHALKNYIDLIVQPGLSFGFDFETGQHLGLLRDRPVQLLLTRSSTAEGDPHDFQLPYLTHVLGFIGLRDVRTVVAEATTRAPDARAAYVAEHCELAREAAAEF